MEAKIGQLEVALHVEQQVVGLHVAVREAERVERVNRERGLGAVEDDLGLREAVALDQHCAAARPRA